MFVARRGGLQSSWRLAAGRGLASAQSRAGSSQQPKTMTATVDAYAEGPTTLVTKAPFKFIIDEPPKLGGRGMGPNPLTHFLGSLVACSQYTLTMIAKERKLPVVQRALWSAEGKYDLRGVQGTGAADARFQAISVTATVDTDTPQEELDSLAEEVEKRCIVASTCKASGMEMALTLKKGSVDHDCKPACELHDLEQAGPSTGTASGTPGTPSGKEGDSPKFSGTQGQGKPAAVAAGRRFHSAAWARANGEDVAREHLHAELEPQLQKETSEEGAPETRGGAYASRDSPRAQAAPPTDGLSEKDIIEQQTAGADTPPKVPTDDEGEEGPRAPGFAGE